MFMWQLTMCPQPKAKSFLLVRQIGQAYNQIEKHISKL
jgi:hypothetical protein